MIPKSRLDGFEVLTFDCYGTLIDWEAGILGALRPVLAAHGAGLGDKPLLELYARLSVALHEGAYVPTTPEWLPAVGLGLVLWQGTYEKKETTWLRWCDQQKQVIPTGAERAERLAAQLRALGIEPAS